MTISFAGTNSGAILLCLDLAGNVFQGESARVTQVILTQGALCEETNASSPYLSDPPP